MPSLFERLGGLDVIRAVVDDFVGSVAADARINHLFATADIARLKVQLVDQLCVATGGPCTYGGRSMKEAHKGVPVTGEHFAAAIEVLDKSLVKLEVPEDARSELLTTVGELKGDIVAR